MALLRGSVFFHARTPNETQEAFVAQRGQPVSCPFAAWLNIAHAAVMTVMAIHLPNERHDLLIASGVFALIGVGLIALLPAKQSSCGLVSTT